MDYELLIGKRYTSVEQNKVFVFLKLIKNSITTRLLQIPRETGAIINLTLSINVLKPFNTKK